VVDREATRALGGAKPTTAVAERARRAAANFIVERVWMEINKCVPFVGAGAPSFT
jgi:hypothetical protein